MDARHRLRLAAVWALTFLCLAVTLWGVDPLRVAGALAEARWSLVLVAAATVASSFALRVARYQLLLGRERPTVGRQLAASGIGFLALQVAPLRLGELVRPFLLAEAGVPWGRSLGALVVERALDLAVLALLLGALGLLDLPGVVEVGGVDVVAAGQRAAAIGTPVLAVLVAALAIGGERVAARVGPRLGGLTRAARAVLLELGERPAGGLAAFLLSLGVWGGTVGTVLVLLEALPGLPGGLPVAWTVAAVTVAGVAAVPTPGMVGPFEAFSVASLHLWGVERERAAAFALLWHLVVFGFHAAIGVALLAREGLSLGHLVRRSRGAR